MAVVWMAPLLKLKCRIQAECIFHLTICVSIINQWTENMLHEFHDSQKKYDIRHRTTSHAASAGWF